MVKSVGPASTTFCIQVLASCKLGVVVHTSKNVERGREERKDDQQFMAIIRLHNEVQG